MLAFAFVELFGVKGIHFSLARQTVIKISLLFAFSCGVAVCARAQYLVQADGENVQQRIARARALAAVGNLPAARSELESLTHAQSDESVREIALVLLVGVYLEQADYGYAEGLLNETFAARQARRDEATHAYFALAGQVINGVRAHVERYRALGLDVADASLPPEATGDLDHLRALLERVVAHGKQLGAEGGGMEASALIEEAATVRARLARGAGERTQWQREVADARQRLAGSNARMTVGSVRPAANPPATDTSAPTPTPAAPSPTPVPTPTPVPRTETAPAPANTTTSTGGAQQSTAAAPSQTDAPKQSEPGTTPAQPLDVGGALIAKAKDKVAPSYPTQARSARVSGNVTVFLTVDEKGEVAEVKRTNGPEMLRQAAVDAARRWKFRPTLVNGQPVRVSGYINFNFTL